MVNLGVIFNTKENKPECVIVHDYTSGEIGYSTYSDKLSELIEIIFNNDVYLESKFNNKINCKICTKENPYYISTINEYLPTGYKVQWIKSVEGDINQLLEESYEILD